MTGFGILGTGMVAEYHRKAIEANAGLGARLVAVSTRDPAGFAKTAETFGVPCLAWEDMLARPDIDVVCICTPSGLHASQAITAARAGKHALVEKPMALDLEDAEAMIQAFSKNDRLLGVALQRRAQPMFQKIHQAVSAGDLGDLTTGLVTIPYQRTQDYFDQAPWRGTWSLDGGGVIMNQGIHLVDLLVWFMGDPVEIRAFGGTLEHRIEVEDTLTASLRFKNGAMASVTATTTAAPGFPHRVEIYGRRGGIQVEGESIAGWRLVDPGQARVTPLPVETRDDAGAGADPRGIDLTGHINLIENFVQTLSGNQALLIDGHEGRRSLAAVVGMYRAAGLI